MEHKQKHESHHKQCAKKYADGGHVDYVEHVKKEHGKGHSHEHEQDRVERMCSGGKM